jgi:hypothetical protein
MAPLGKLFSFCKKTTQFRFITQLRVSAYSSDLRPLRAEYPENSPKNNTVFRFHNESPEIPVTLLKRHTTISSQLSPKYDTHITCTQFRDEHSHAVACLLLFIM